MESVPVSQSTAAVPGLQIRTASQADEPAIVKLVHGNPGDELLGVLGDPALARRCRMAIGGYLTHRDRVWERTKLAITGHKAIGALVWSRGRSYGASVDAGLVFAALRVLGLRRTWAMYRFDVLQQKITPKPPRNSFYIAELHVAPAYRNRGVGAYLLRHADVLAAAAGCPCVSLNTGSTNPARRLYARAGFRVAEERTDPAYARLCGVPGRVLMVKDLEGSAAEFAADEQSSP